MSLSLNEIVRSDGETKVKNVKAIHAHIHKMIQKKNRKVASRRNKGRE